MMRIFCDGCDRDISEEAHVSVRIAPARSIMEPEVKLASWDWCVTCALSNGIRVEPDEGAVNN